MPDYRQAARRAAQRVGLDPDIFERQIGAESNFNPNARSAYAIGIAQITPDTARGWGVDPTNPIASLNAAARHMKQYVDQYGSYEDALRAYNAGPARIRQSHTFAETNAYVQKILGGRNPKVTRGGGGGAQSAITSATSRQLISPAVNRAPERLQLALSFLSAQRNDPVSFVQGLRERADVPAQYRTTTNIGLAPGMGGAGSRTEGPVHGSQVLELFWQGQNGINIKNGQRVPQGFVSGHTDHVHVAAGPKTVVMLGKIAQQKFGLHVGENPHFGGVDPVHVQGSYHYKNEAIDVSGDPRKMAAFAHYVAGYNQARH
jgi:hypothetical protein